MSNHRAPARSTRRDLSSRHRGELTVHPPALPGEAISGYVMRAIYLNEVSLTPASRHLFGADQFMRLQATLLPKHTATLVRHTAEVFGDVCTAVFKHTVYPALTWMGSKRECDDILANVTSHNPRTQSNTLSVLGIGKHYLRHCLDCAVEDRARFGVAYWRSMHQLSVCVVCPLHEKAIVGGCGHCLYFDLLTSAHPLPQTRCRCGQEQEPLVSRDDPAFTFFLKIAQIIAAMLAAPQPDFVGELGAGVMLDKLLERGIITTCSNVKQASHELTEHLTLDGTIGNLQRLGFREIGLRAIRNVLLGRPSSCRGVRVALIACLFGTLEAFVERCARRSELPLPKSRNHSKSWLNRKPEEGVLVEAQRVALELAEQHGSRRREVVFAARTNLRSLLRNHAHEWFMKEFPLEYKKRRGSFMHGRWHFTDAATAEHVRQRANRLLEGQSRPRWLSQRALAAGIVSNTGKARPLTRLALDEYTETATQFRLRCLQWAIRNRDSFPTRGLYARYIEKRMGAEGVARLDALLLEGRQPAEADLLGQSVASKATPKA